MDLTPFIRLINERYGLAIAEDNSLMLSTAVKNRMQARKMNCHNQYLNALIEDDEENHHLIDLLAVNETYFLREPSHFDLLVNRLMPEALARRKSLEKIGILSAGCSTGEEAYSVVMALCEKFGPGIMESVSVKGFDIDRAAVASAQEGIYSKHSFRGLSQERLDKYFVKLAENRFKLHDVFRKAVEFRVCNLMQDVCSEEQRAFDVIFYRNVSIYFNPATQARVFEKLSRLAKDRGYVFLSSSETYSHNIGIMFLVELDGIFLYRKEIDLHVEDRRKLLRKLPFVMPAAPNGSRPKADISRRDAANPPVGQKRKDSRSLFDKALMNAKNKNYHEALVCIDELLTHEPNLAKAHNLQASILINLQLLDEAKYICLLTLKLDEWNLECHLLLGIIARIGGDNDEAMKHFKGALYIQPSCWLAHLYLGDIYNAQSHIEAACREYRLTMKFLQDGPLPESGLSFFPLSYPVEQLAHLCKHNLENLEKRLL